MSTNKTEHYDLHAWVAEDSFLLSEINENFTAIDAGLGGRYRVVMGAYQGDGTPDRSFDLGAPIAALLLESAETRRPNYAEYQVFGGLALPGHQIYNDAIVVEGSAFRVKYLSQDRVRNYTNLTGMAYVYLAWLKQN